MNTMFLMVVLTGGSVLGAAWFKKRFEETFVITLGAIMTFLYVFYIFNALLIGFYAALILLLACYAVSAYKVIKDKSINPFIESFFTPGFCVFVLLVIIYFLSTHRSTSLLWDELRLWAAVPKVLFYDPTLQLGPNSIVFDYMQSYYPGMSLLNFFCTRVHSREFQEYVLFFVYAVFAGAMMLPCTKHIKFKQFWKIPILSIVFYLIPLTFYNSSFDSGNFYLSLFIDPMLGIAFAYSMYLVWKIKKFDLYNYARYTLSLLTLILMKNSGMALAVMSFAILIIKDRHIFNFSLVKNGKSITFKQYFIGLIKHFAPMIITLAFYKIWNIIVTIYSPNSFIYSQVNENLFPLSDAQLATVKEYFTQIIPKTDIVKAGFSNYFQEETLATWISFFVLFTIISLFLCFVVKGERKKPMRTVMIGMIAASFLYMLGLCWLFVKLSIASHQRYINTSMLAWITLIIMIVITISDDDKESVKKELLCSFIALCAVFYAIVFPIHEPTMGGWLYDVQQLANDNATAITKSIHNNKKRINLFFVQEKDEPLVQHRTFFNLIDDNIILKNYSGNTDVANEARSAEEVQQQWCNVLLQDKFDFVFLENVDELFISQFADLFENGKEDIVSQGCYKVVAKGNSVMLVKQ